MAKMGLAILLVVPGMGAAVVFGYYALIDWAALEEAYQQFELATQQSAELTVVLARATQQDIHRINVFAEGVWFLLSLIIVAIGLHGIFTLPRTSRRG
jgi:hypothetical protein